MSNSRGDWRVLIVMNAILSILFSTIVIWGLDFISALSFSWRNVAILALVLMVVTHVVTR